MSSRGVSLRGGSGATTRAFFLGFAAAPLFLAPLVFFFAAVFVFTAAVFFLAFFRLAIFARRRVFGGGALLSARLAGV